MGMIYKYNTYSGFQPAGWLHFYADNLWNDKLSPLTLELKVPLI